MTDKRWRVEWPENAILPYYVNPDGHRVTDDEMLAELNSAEALKAEVEKGQAVLQAARTIDAAVRSNATNKVMIIATVILCRAITEYDAQNLPNLPVKEAHDETE